MPAKSRGGVARAVQRGWHRERPTDPHPQSTRVHERLQAIRAAAHTRGEPQLQHGQQDQRPRGSQAQAERA